MREQNPPRDPVQGGGAVALLSVSCGLQLGGEAEQAEVALWVKSLALEGRARESVRVLQAVSGLQIA